MGGRGPRGASGVHWWSAIAAHGCPSGCCIDVLVSLFLASSTLPLPCLYLASTLPQLVSTSSLPRLYLVSTLQAAVKAVGELVAAKKVAAGKVASFAQGDVANAMAAAETGAQVALKW